MKVLMTADTVGGVWTYAMELARALDPAGVQIALATMGAPLSSAQWADVTGLENVTVYESRYKLEWMDDPWADVASAGDWLLELERETQPDIIHLNGYVHGSLPWQAPTIVVGHSCVLSWWEAVKGTSAPDSWLTYRRAVSAGLQNANAVVVPTNAMGQALTRHYGPVRDLRVVSNCRSSLPFRSAKKEPLVLSAGRLWDEAKNVSALAAIAPKLPWPVYLAGDASAPGGERAEFQGVSMLGVLTQAQLSEWLSRASLYVLPARYEPFGLSILEAALSGCALVLGDIPSLREVWGDAAIYVHPDDQNLLAKTLLELIEDEPKRQRLSDFSWKRAQCYAPQHSSDAYLTTYRDLQCEKQEKILAYAAR